jgi:aspartate aminotransferase
MSDDAYEHIAYVGHVPHIFEIEPRLKQRGIVFNTLSKAYAMTGWRIGFAAGPRETIGAATRLQSQNSGNPNSIAQAAAVEALTGPQDEIATMAAEFHARRDLVVERVRRIPGFSLPNVPGGAFYAFPNVSAMLKREYKGQPIGHGDRLASIILDEAQVAIVGGNDFDAPNHVRLSYATSREKLTQAFDRIERLAREIMR